MHMKRVSLARTIFLSISAAAALAFLPGCSTMVLSNLTPSTLPENPSQIYTFTLRATPKSNLIVSQSIAPRIVVDGQSYPMKPSSLGPSVYEFDYQLPPGRSEVAYYYLVTYQMEVNNANGPAAREAYTAVERTQIVHRYVLSLEVNRAPTGASVGVFGRGFTPQDVVYFDGAPARTVYSSPTGLSFFVPAMAPGRNYQVTLGGSAGTSPVGTFRIDPTSLTVSPTSLNLRSGEGQTLTFTVQNPAPGSGLLLDVATDIPESVIMPEVIVPAGQTSVSVTVEGGKPGSGSLVLKGYGEGGGVTIPVTVSGK